MKEVTKFTSLTASYPEPDFGVIAQTTKDISRLAFFQTDKMQGVTDKAKRVSAYILDLQTLTGEELVSLSTEVRNLDFSDLFSQLAEIDAELAKGTLKAEEKQAALEARGELEGVFAQRIGGTRDKLIEAAGKMRKQTGDISAVILAERVDETLKRAQARQPELTDAIEKKTLEMGKLDEDRKKIIAAQDVIRAKNIADTIKDFIPKDLEKLDLKKPEAEAIRLGVEVLKKILGEISEGFKYSDLADQRKAFDQKIADLDEAIRGLQADQRENNALVDDLTGVMTIGSKRDVLLGEVGKLPVAFSGFAESLGNLNGSQVTETTVTKLIQTMKSYLGKCLDARNKVIVV